MNDNLIKSGGCSLIVGRNHYEGYFPYKKNKLFKISKIIANHNETTNLEIVRKINNYENYYVIPDEESFTIDIVNDKDFYYHILEIAHTENIDFFIGNLHCFYINNGGDMDLFEAIKYFDENEDRRVFSNYNSITAFTKQITEGLYYLHTNKIAHLDIKPENIMIKMGRTTRFTIIDFGFASLEPFDSYIKDIRGTPGYFPRNISKPEFGLPEIKANDMILVNGGVPCMKNRQLIYKIDNYCLGRIVNMIYEYYKINIIPVCFPCYKKSKRKVLNIINTLLESDVYKRKQIVEIIDKNLF